MKRDCSYSYTCSHINFDRKHQNRKLNQARFTRLSMVLWNSKLNCHAQRFEAGTAKDVQWWQNLNFLWKVKFSKKEIDVMEVWTIFNAPWITVQILNIYLKYLKSSFWKKKRKLIQWRSKQLSMLLWIAVHRESKPAQHRICSGAKRNQNSHLSLSHYLF